MQYTDIAVPDALISFSPLEALVNGSRRFAERLPLVSDYWVKTSMVRPKFFYMEGLFTQERSEGGGVPIRR